MSEGNYGADLFMNHTYKALRVIGQGYNLLYTVWCSGERELYDLIADPYALDNIHPPMQPMTNNNITGRRSFLNDSLSNNTIDFHTETPPSPLAADLHAPPTYFSSQATTLTKSNLPLEVPIERLLQRLNALLALLKTCKGCACTHPWEFLCPYPHCSPFPPLCPTSPSFPSPAINSTGPADKPVAGAANPPNAIRNLREALDPFWDNWFDSTTEDWAFSWCELGYIAAAEMGGPWGSGAAMGLEVDVGALEREGNGGVGGQGLEVEEGKGSADVVRTEL
ncbi:uncharacterized protein AB675_6051 [Cyphellophora attinorum]|uniref:Arylsulfatase n=1 Tax=Cyphellophora attinorum TaxID=1664694 RepID=A0A0N0NJF4_9EURO|nr:uncharacterized protein AB675_6051 [Phialophora attinorum]KPI36921.1 hypothetical protein AB675_6051 [Phialophora attinorum]